MLALAPLSSAPLSSLLSAGQIFSAVIMESAVASEQGFAAGNVFNATTIVTANAFDENFTNHFFFGEIEEDCSATQIASAQVGFVTTVDEAATGSDEISRTLTISPSLSESATASEQVTAGQDHASNIDETALGADTLDTTFTYFSVVDEDATTSSSIS